MFLGLGKFTMPQDEAGARNQKGRSHVRGLSQWSGSSGKGARVDGKVSTLAAEAQRQLAGLGMQETLSQARLQQGDPFTPEIDRDCMVCTLEVQRRLETVEGRHKELQKVDAMKQSKQMLPAERAAKAAEHVAL